MTPRQGTFAAFITFGIFGGLWAGSIPTVVARAGVSPAGFGIATTFAAVTTILGLAAAGYVARHLALRTMLIGALATCIGLAAVILNAPGPITFYALILAFSFAAGFCDASMNAEATLVERDLGRPAMAAFHAAISLVIGVLALAGSALSEYFGTFVTAAVAMIGGAAGIALVRRGTPLRPIDRGTRSDPEQTKHRRGPGITLPLVLLGLVVGVSNAGEGSAQMFSAATIRDIAPELAPWAGLGVFAFALCQAFARALTDRARRHVSDPMVILWAVAIAGAGFLVIALSNGIFGVAVGLAIVGVGTAPIVPCGFVLAPKVSGLPAARAIGYMSLVSSLTRIPVPWAFGQVAEMHGYPPAYLLNAVLMAVAFALTLAMVLGRRTTEPR
ncbi:MAG: hypothetical protein N2422_12640 [Rhodobacteraceae bacterium]|nr:hypothetical protein [Paracoccaceae bacterium]